MLFFPWIPKITIPLSLELIVRGMWKEQNLRVHFCKWILKALLFSFSETWAHHKPWLFYVQSFKKGGGGRQVEGNQVFVVCAKIVKTERSVKNFIGFLPLGTYTWKLIHLKLFVKLRNTKSQLCASPGTIWVIPTLHYCKAPNSYPSACFKFHWDSWACQEQCV